MPKGVGYGAKAQRKIMAAGSKYGGKVRKAAKALAKSEPKKKASSKTKAPKASKRVNKGK